VVANALAGSIAVRAIAEPDLEGDKHAPVESRRRAVRRVRRSGRKWAPRHAATARPRHVFASKRVVTRWKARTPTTVLVLAVHHKRRSVFCSSFRPCRFEPR
jgi:hypothetical protein